MTRKPEVSAFPENYHSSRRREAATWLTLPARGSVGPGAVLFWPVVRLLGSGSVPGAPLFVEMIKMVDPNKRSQHAAVDHAIVTTAYADNADIIRQELRRRSKFDKQHKKALLRLMTRPESREGDQAGKGRGKARPHRSRTPHGL